MSAWFYRVAWSLQLAFGVLLFLVAALLETLVLHAYFGQWWLALSLAAALEALKILVIVGHRMLVGQAEAYYPRGVRLAAFSFRGLLLGLSAACSLMFLAAQLDRPGMDRVRAADLAAVAERYVADSDAARVDHEQRRDAALAELDRRLARERDALAARHQPSIEALEAQLSAEMDVVVNGEFIGPRYQALQERLRDEKTAFDDARAALAQADAERRDALLVRLDAQLATQLAALTATRDSRQAALSDSDYQGDPRVEHPLARAFVNTLGAVFAEPPTVLQFVFVFSLLLSLAVELGIWVSFEQVTLARLPVFEARHRAELFAASKAVETESALRGFEFDTELAKAKAKQRRSAIDELLQPDPTSAPSTADTTWARQGSAHPGRGGAGPAPASGADAPNPVASGQPGHNGATRKGTSPPAEEPMH
jgi:hypothetical protein